MKFPNKYSRVIAIAEQSGGNERVGDMWLDTKSFSPDTRVAEIIGWAERAYCRGKLILTIDESTEGN